ncbi:hypothetical protein KKB99_03200 [bacterium]|nr:hypothetical protein [bacterium]MBU1024997.1 hypothetical protein [bacterium]
MIRMIVAIIVMIIAVAVFYYAKGVFGWTLGVRTYWPAFAALFFYTIYVLSLDKDNKDKKTSK